MGSSSLSLAHAIDSLPTLRTDDIAPDPRLRLDVPEAKKSRSVLQAGNAIRRTDRAAGRRSSPLSMRLAPADAEPESGRSCRAVASRRCDPQVIDNLQSGFCDAVMGHAVLTENHRWGMRESSLVL